MPAGSIASLPWVAWSWLDTAWEADSWGVSAPIAIPLDPPFQLVGLDGNGGSIDVHGLTQSFHAFGSTGAGTAASSTEPSVTVAAQMPSFAVHGQRGSITAQGQAPSLGVQGRSWP